MVLPLPRAAAVSTGLRVRGPLDGPRLSRAVAQRALLVGVSEVRGSGEPGLGSGLGPG